ncbi:UNVERIFIED_CONTAM: hypothetical protein K2H54_074356 [Gekko kuhli]
MSVTRWGSCLGGLLTGLLTEQCLFSSFIPLLPSVFFKIILLLPCIWASSLRVILPSVAAILWSHLQSYVRIQEVPTGSKILWTPGLQQVLDSADLSHIYMTKNIPCKTLLTIG